MSPVENKNPVTDMHTQSNSKLILLIWQMELRIKSDFILTTAEVYEGKLAL